MIKDKDLIYGRKLLCATERMVPGQKFYMPVVMTSFRGKQMSWKPYRIVMVQGGIALCESVKTHYKESFTFWELNRQARWIIEND